MDVLPVASTGQYLLPVPGNGRTCAGMRVDCSGGSSGGVRRKLRGSDLQEAEVNDLLEHLF